MCLNSTYMATLYYNTKIKLYHAPHIQLMKNLSAEHENWIEDYMLMNKGEGISNVRT